MSEEDAGNSQTPTMRGPTASASTPGPRRGTQSAGTRAASSRGKSQTRKQPEVIEIDDSESESDDGQTFKVSGDPNPVPRSSVLEARMGRATVAVTSGRGSVRHRPCSPLRVVALWQRKACPPFRLASTRIDNRCCAHSEREADPHRSLCAHSARRSGFRWLTQQASVSRPMGGWRRALGCGVFVCLYIPIYQSHLQVPLTELAAVCESHRLRGQVSSVDSPPQIKLGLANMRD